MLIIHGENTVLSRQALTEYIAVARQKELRVARVDAKSLDKIQLEEFLGHQSLFGDEQLLVIEELHSLPKSKRKEELIQFLGENNGEIVLWEKKLLSATMLKKFPGCQSKEFKLTSNLFKWLDTLTGQPTPASSTTCISLFRQAVKNDGEVMCFTFLIRQVRLLLQAKENNFEGMAPFIVAKLRKQATTFSQEQLLKIHHRLLELDIAQKSSPSRLSLAAELELLMTEM
jgi:DNA polymerase III delta subunit